MSDRDLTVLATVYGIEGSDLAQALDTAEIRQATDDKAAEVLAYWQEIAPVRTEGRDHEVSSRIGDGMDVEGAYRDSIESIPTTIADSYAVRVGSPDPKSEWIEYGSIHNPEYGCAAKVVDHFTGEVTPE